jgi:hypothetical protein
LNPTYVKRIRRIRVPLPNCEYLAAHLLLIHHSVLLAGERDLKKVFKALKEI